MTKIIGDGIQSEHEAINLLSCYHSYTTATTGVRFYTS